MCSAALPLLLQSRSDFSSLHVRNFIALVQVFNIIYTSNPKCRRDIINTNKGTAEINVYLFAADYSPLHLVRPEQLLDGRASQGNF